MGWAERAAEHTENVSGKGESRVGGCEGLLGTVAVGCGDDEGEGGDGDGDLGFDGVEGALV